MATTFDRLKTLVIEHLGVSEDEVTLESNLRNDLGADSLDVVELVMEVEDEFDVEISDEDAETLHTIADVINYIESKQ